MNEHSYLSNTISKTPLMKKAIKAKRIIASAQITLTDVHDGEDGDSIPADLYDGSFRYGKKLWSISYANFIEPGNNVNFLEKATESINTDFGNTRLEIQNDT
ncbi:hypothetical protein [Paraclostridium dentum]|uniref:hypothetical protein n=1 Tax=Paraclostridium dentum TaxID=2662455 RepID=UPI003F3BEBCA